MNENKIEVFNSTEFGTVRTVQTDDGKILFCGSDVAKALGYNNAPDAISKHCKKDGIAKCDSVDSLGRKNTLSFITEGNVYRLITHSRLPEAERFETWVFDEVLPTIRRHGTYSVTKVRISPDFPIQFATISYDGKKVLTTSQLAQAYGTTVRAISQSFNRSKEHFIEGTHFYRLTGEELRTFKNNPKNVGIVSRQTSILYIWTEAGSLLHTKNLNTDKAYEVYEYLLGKYFSTPETVSPYNDLLRKFDELSERIKKLESISDTKRLMTVQGRSPDWRKATHSLINRIAIATDSEIRDVYLDIYEEIEYRAGVNLSRRLENLRDRAYDRGIPENKIRRMNTIDVIADDKKLTEIYIAVVKETAVKYNVSGKEVI